MAMSAAFQRFFADGAAHAPGALPQSLQAELMNTLRDFLQAVDLWQTQLTLAITPASIVYAVSGGAGQNINRLLNLFDPTDINQPWIWPASMATPGTIILGRQPTSNYSWVAQLSLYPTDPVDADGNPVFPAWILDKYFDALFNGMIGRLCMQNAKPWTNRQTSLDRMKLYKSGIAVARNDISKTNVYGKPNWLYPGTFAGRSGRQLGA